jgi:hypothetical protein
MPQWGEKIGDRRRMLLGVSVGGAFSLGPALYVSATSENVDYAAAFLSALVEEHQKEWQSIQAEAVESATRVLSDELARMEEKIRAAEDDAAGVLSDTLGRMAGSEHRPAPDLVLREVIVRSPDEPGGVIRLLTNLLEVEAWAIAQLYRYRWQVELFFRWLKFFANFAHLISESRQGVLLSFHVAVIGVLLMYLHTGAKPSKSGA